MSLTISDILETATVTLTAANTDYTATMPAEASVVHMLSNNAAAGIKDVTAGTISPLTTLVYTTLKDHNLAGKDLIFRSTGAGHIIYLIIQKGKLI